MQDAVLRADCVRKMQAVRGVTQGNLLIKNGAKTEAVLRKKDILIVIVVRKIAEKGCYPK